ncbi:hypothetical protein [Azospirillum sp. TSO35-2]|uniref:hypothetical protein n=1 Tax=Azospirillum sp. TSO35-2 TaxID=716796 RepID=UPI000D606309|nr:hypothetical protein [Azospirillum sp. TSO35-2]PWC34125.1 hypothetical protein TSO352_27855 [Azospirillum sp. TSO35-2]
MWQDYTNALLTAFGLSGLGFGIGKLVIITGERAIERRHGSEGARDTIARRAKMETRFEARRTERAAELKQIDNSVEETLRRRKTLERQLEDQRRSGDRLVRLIGEEVKGCPCFVAMVVNKYVGTANFQQSQHALIGSSWSQPQTVEVWARSMPDARAEIERRYPPAFGYTVTRMQEFLAPESSSKPPAQPAVAKAS